MSEIQETEKQSNVYILHRFLAVFFDFLVILAFVVIGEKNHGRDMTTDKIVLVALPFLTAYFGIMLIIAKDLRSMKTAAIASVIAVPLAVLMRIQYDTAKFPFILIAMAFITFFVVAWRFLLEKLRPSTPKDS